jgi:hypothetical protein
MFVNGRAMGDDGCSVGCAYLYCSNVSCGTVRPNLKRRVQIVAECVPASLTKVERKIRREESVKVYSQVFRKITTEDVTDSPFLKCEFVCCLFNDAFSVAQNI